MSRINSKVSIIDEWSDFYKGKHYMLIEIENTLYLVELIPNWKK